MRSRRGPGSGRTRPPTSTIRSSFDRRTRTESHRRARWTDRPVPTGSVARAPDGGGCGRASPPSEPDDPMKDQMRGRTTRERRLAEKVEREWAERRAAYEGDTAARDAERPAAPP